MKIVRNALALTAVFAAIAGAASAGSVVLKSNPVDDDVALTVRVFLPWALEPSPLR